ncbi:Bud-site selection protein [Morchella snyderi]|nr:Bud-site selection protein [Morchella snyderi]
MPPKRKQPFLSTPQYARKHPRLGPRFQKENEKDSDPPTDLSNPSSLPPQVIGLVRKAVEEKIEHGIKLVSRGLKKAKGFEKQKLVKRLKIAREKGEDAAVKKLELEFEVLKTEEMDLNSLASNHVLKTFSKYKPISTSPLFPPWLAPRKELEAQPNGKEIAKRNIIARLYNSNAVKEAMAIVVENVKSVMGMSYGVIKGKRKVTEIKTNAGYESEEGGGETVETVRLVKRMKIDNKSTTEEESESEDEEEEWGGILNSEESVDSEIDPDAFAADFMDRVAGSSDEDEDQGPLQRGTDDEWSGEDDEDDEDDKNDEEDEEDDEEYQGERGQNAKPTSKPKSESKSSPNQHNQTQEATNLKAKKSEKLKPVDSVKSTFLPTLMSGYISGSDSDIDADYYKDKNGKKKGPAQPKERKNRMGQQARRALWEKKFGKEANHVKKGEEEKGREKIEQRIKQGRGGGGKKQESAPEKKVKPTEVEGPLHPSWEAARKAKEQQAKVQEAVKGKPMGKKIVFD